LLEAVRRHAGNDEAIAWGSLVANLLVLPGLGSLLVGRKVGWLQAALALGGFVLMLVWLGSFVVTWINRESMPLDGGPELGRGLLGVGLSLGAWLWSLASSLGAIRSAGKR
jgi:hypothetical protein